MSRTLAFIEAPADGHGISASAEYAQPVGDFETERDLCLRAVDLIAEHPGAQFFVDGGFVHPDAFAARTRGSSGTRPGRSPRRSGSMRWPTG
jgi:hypothetical protein